MDKRHSVSEFDLLAYADDPLGLESRRRQAVEAHLRYHPADAALVEAFRRQNAALRERYDPWLRRPVPPRLYRALDTERPPYDRRLFRYAAAASVVVAAGLAGWAVGGGENGPPQVAVSEATLTPDQLAAGDGTAGTPPGQPLSVAGVLEYGPAPLNLSELGFSLVAADPVAASSRSVRLTYAREDGQTFTLMLRSRWHDADPGFRLERQGDVSVVAWEDGRLAAELTSRMARHEALEIAEAVRDWLKSVEPALPGPVPVDGVLAAGSADAMSPAGTDAPAPPKQVR